MKIGQIVHEAENESPLGVNMTELRRAVRVVCGLRELAGAKQTILTNMTTNLHIKAYLLCTYKETNEIIVKIKRTNNCQ